MAVVLFKSFSIEIHSRAIYFDANSPYEVPKANIHSIRRLAEFHRETDDTETFRDMKIKQWPVKTRLCML